jgi:hypothetical protein
MFHTMRHTIRLVFLTIGFLLFVVMAVHSAETARDRQAVVGKPMLWQAQHTALSSLLGLNDAGQVQATAVAVHIPSPSNSSSPQQEVSVSTTPEQSNLTSHTASQNQEDEDDDDDDSDLRVVRANDTSPDDHEIIRTAKHDK